MYVKRSLEEIKKSDRCNFVELCEVLNVSRSTLTKQQNKYDLFPCDRSGSYKVGAKTKVPQPTMLYPVAVCTKIYKMFQGKIKEGFTAKAAAMRTKESTAYQKLVGG